MEGFDEACRIHRIIRQSYSYTLDDHGSSRFGVKQLSADAETGIGSEKTVGKQTEYPLSVKFRGKSDNTG